MNSRDMASLTAEKTDLGIHVEMCVIRHNDIMDSLEELKNENNKRWSRFEKIAYSVLAFLTSALGFTAVELMPIVRTAIAGG